MLQLLLLAAFDNCSVTVEVFPQLATIGNCSVSIDGAWTWDMLRPFNRSVLAAALREERRLAGRHWLWGMLMGWRTNCCSSSWCIAYMAAAACCTAHSTQQFCSVGHGTLQQYHEHY
jgi:hypothetical protein